MSGIILKESVYHEWTRINTNGGSASSRGRFRLLGEPLDSCSLVFIRGLERKHRAKCRFRLIVLQRVQHSLDARHFVGAEQVRLAQRGEHREKRLGAADLLAEILESMRQRVANRETECAE